MMHDANANAAMLKGGQRFVVEFDEKPDCLVSDRARNVAGDVGERAIPSLVAAGPNRTERRRQRHRPYPTKKDLPPRVDPLWEPVGQRQYTDPVEVKLSKLDEDTVVEVGHTRYLVRMDPEDVWARYMARSHDDKRREFNQAHKNDLLNIFGYGPRQAAKPAESIDTRWGIMEVISREEAEQRGWLPADGSA